jgi:hypothetical protein
MTSLLTILSTILGFLLDSLKKYPWQTISVILALALWLSWTSRPTIPPKTSSNPYNDTITHTDTITYYDTITLSEEPYQPELAAVDSGFWLDWSWVDVNPETPAIEIDTNYWFQYFMSTLLTNYYIDTVVDNEHAVVIVFDSVRENKIISRSVKGDYFPQVKHIIENNYITQQTPPSNIFYLGSSLNGWDNSFGVTLKAGLKDKKDFMYTVGYNPILQYAEFGVMAPIKFRRKKDGN